MSDVHSDAVVEMTDAQVCYGSFRAVDGITLQVERGEVLGLLGHNGAGKTTSIKLILGLLQPSAGQVRVFGQIPFGQDSKDARRGFGYLPENVSFYDQLSGREVLRFFARLKGHGRQACDALLQRVGLEQAADRRVKTYSKGMRQRLGLAQALLGEPRLLLLDEPTVGLDPVATHEFYGMLDELVRQGTTVILCSHVLPGIEGHIDRVAILEHGHLLALGTPQALRDESALPLRISARGQWAGADWPQRLAGLGVEDYAIHADCLEVTCTQAAKLAVSRSLLDAQGIQDIEITSPSLQDLYMHYSGRPAAAAQAAATQTANQAATQTGAGV